MYVSKGAIKTPLLVFLLLSWLILHPMIFGIKNDDLVFDN